jgi:cytoskeletal protein RodZ
MTSDREISLGEFLRQERERRGITIEQVASATKVGVRTLHSLEADHYADLPAKPFIRGFVTSYCRFIGLDPKEILARFEEYIHSKANERPNRDSGHSGYAFEKKDGEQQSRTILTLTMCGFILLGALAMLFLKPSLRHHRSSHIDKLRAAHSGDAQVQASPQPSPSGVAALPSSAAVPIVKVLPQEPLLKSSPSPVPSIVNAKVEEKTQEENKVSGAGENAADPLDSGLELKGSEIHHKVVVKVLADLWVRYQLDNRPMRRFIVRKGRTLVLRAKDAIRLQVSNMNSATLNYNNQGPKVISQIKSATVKQGNTTLFFPNELSEKIEKPFGDVSPLTSTEDPVSEDSSQQSDSDA